MAVTEQELNEALGRAAALMSPEGQRQIEFAGRQNANSYNSDGDFTNATGAKYNRQQNLFTEQQRSKQRQTVNNNSGLPKAILESINQNPLNDVMSEYSIQGSVLDNVDTTSFRQQYATTNNTASYINEQQYRNEAAPYINEDFYRHNVLKPQYDQYQPQYVPQPQYMQQQMPIDYNYIRAIVNECVQANLKQIKEEILKESTLKVVRLGGENKIQLIDNKNNLYESKLEFKKNLNKK
jgi:hypothetical protein